MCGQSMWGLSLSMVRQSQCHSNNLSHILLMTEAFYKLEDESTDSWNECFKCKSLVPFALLDGFTWSYISTEGELWRPETLQNSFWLQVAEVLILHIIPLGIKVILTSAQKWFLGIFLMQDNIKVAIWWRDESVGAVFKIRHKQTVSSLLKVDILARVFLTDKHALQ